MSRIILLTKGMTAVIDDDDSALVDGLSWFAAISAKAIYAHSSQYMPGHNPLTIRMHRRIVGALPGQIVDHINGNGLDNRRENLRVCSHKENIWNQRKRLGSSQYRGVTLSQTGNRWRAMICVDHKLTFIGSFTNEQEAARAYDERAIAVFGQFARLNFPKEQP